MTFAEAVRDTFPGKEIRVYLGLHDLGGENQLSLTGHLTDAGANYIELSAPSGLSTKRLVNPAWITDVHELPQD